METRKISLEPEKYYLIYNRGNNGENIFFEERNYTYFLQKYFLYVHPLVNTFAYCLMRNHFHVLIQVKPENEIRNHLAEKHKNKSCSWIVSIGFSSLFKSYAQAINKKFEKNWQFV
jgi:putative transposase